MDKKLAIKNDSKTRRGFLQGAAKWIGGKALLAATANVFTSNKVNADTSSINSADPFIGEIMMVGYNFAPRNWAFCSGQLLSISQNQALFSLLGTSFGGDGRTTFGLPDLQGRVPMHSGNGPGLSPRRIGQKSGSENVTLTTAQIPAHNHSTLVNSAGGTSDNPVNNYMASNSEGVKHYSSTIGTGGEYGGGTANAGVFQSHNNMQPYTVVNFVIALYGTFPSRN